MLVLPIFLYRSTTNGIRRNAHEDNRSRKRLAAPHQRTKTYRNSRKASQESCQRSRRAENHSTKEERQIGEVFKEAEKNAPTLLFFDEFDAMVPRRSGEEGNQHYDSEVNEFLCMLNNASDKGVYVLAATNHPERIDKAVLRTGRIDEMVYIDMPDMEARKSLFALELSKLPTEGNIDTAHLSELTNGYNCSDISYIVKSAARKKFNETIRRNDGKRHGVTQEVLEEIIAAKSPSVSAKSLREYERVRSEFSPKDKGLKPATIGFR